VQRPILPICFFPLVEGGGWLLLFAGVAIFGALVTNAMANVAAAALILPIVIPMAQLEGVDPRVLALCMGTATSFAMLLVIGCPPNAIAYSFKEFKAADITRAGLGGDTRSADLADRRRRGMVEHSGTRL
jgi:sodium-dependent dicarboxylate transporter 2/3/5